MIWEPDSLSSIFLFMTRNQQQTSILKCRQDFLYDIVSQFISRRNDLGVSQDEVDERMGNCDRLVSKWECGQRTPTSFNLYCWAIALGGVIDFLANEGEKIND